MWIICWTILFGRYRLKITLNVQYINASINEPIRTSISNKNKKRIFDKKFFYELWFKILYSLWIFHSVLKAWPTKKFENRRHKMCVCVVTISYIRLNCSTRISTCGWPVQQVYTIYKWWNILVLQHRCTREQTWYDLTITLFV